ncbi:hypothetical protein JHK82_022471 [Glycine max]|nr:hypothetical protein JHK82_022471 [Glycine max]
MRSAVTIGDNKENANILSQIAPRDEAFEFDDDFIGPPTFDQPKMTSTNLLEYGNMLVQEQKNVNTDLRE